MMCSQGGKAARKPSAKKAAEAKIHATKREPKIGMSLVDNA